VILASKNGGKTAFVIAVTKDAVPLGLHAGTIASLLAKKIGGKGGGKELFAQGGGPDVKDLEKILEGFPEEIIKNLLE
jgi:alanyl-tRNA synthetase